MHLFPTFLSVLASVAFVQSNPRTGSRWREEFTEWYNVGIEFGDKSVVDTHINNACYGWSGNRGFYQDMYFKPWNQSPYSAKLCVNIGPNHLNFEIANVNPDAGFTLRPNDCAWGFGGMMNSMQGGELQKYGWWYRLDPNVGNC